MTCDAPMISHVSTGPDTFTWRVQPNIKYRYITVERDDQFRAMCGRFLDGRQTTEDYRYMARKIFNLEKNTPVRIFPDNALPQNNVTVFVGDRTVNLSASEILSVLKESFSTIPKKPEIEVEIYLYDGDTPSTSLIVTTGDTTIAMCDDGLWPSPEKLEGGDWRSDEGGNSRTQLNWKAEQGVLHFYNQVSGSGGDSWTCHDFRGELASYLVAIAAQLYHVGRGGSFKAPTSPYGEPLKMTIHGLEE